MIMVDILALDRRTKLLIGCCMLLCEPMLRYISFTSFCGHQSDLQNVSRQVLPLSHCIALSLAKHVKIYQQPMVRCVTEDE